MLTGFGGDLDLLTLLADIFNTYFHPKVPVQSTHLAVAPDAAGCLDALLYNICDAGDDVLISSLYWSTSSHVLVIAVNPLVYRRVQYLLFESIEGDSGPCHDTSHSGLFYKVFRSFFEKSLYRCRSANQSPERL